MREQPQTPNELVERLRENAASASAFSSWASEEDELQAASFLSGLSSGFYTSALQLSRILMLAAEDE